AGEDILSPIYDFGTHTRTQETRHVPAAEFVLVDGIMALVHADLRPVYSLSIFLRVDDETRFRRRLKRDTEGRDRSEQSVIEQWNATVLPFHHSDIEPSAEFADFIVQTQDFDALVDSFGYLTSSAV
ncbi:MAG: uridine kinase, partial [Planctomycetota bacterium]